MQQSCLLHREHEILNPANHISPLTPIHTQTLNTSTAISPDKTAQTIHTEPFDSSTSSDNNLSSNNLQFCNSSLDFFNIGSDEIVSSVILSDEESTSTEKLRTSLREWVCEENIKSTSVNKL